MWLTTKRHRLVFFAALGVFFLATLAELFLIRTVLEKNAVRNAKSAFVFLEARIGAYLETLRLLPQVPEYLQDLAWLTDELQGQPSLVGVLVREGKNVLLNTFPGSLFLLPQEILEKCHQGIMKDEIYFYCGEFESVPDRKLFLLVGIDLSYEKQVFREAVLLTLLIFLTGGILLGLAFYYVDRLSRRQEELEKRLLASEKLATMGKLSAMIAHEIRNPLNSILMGLQYMAEVGHLSPELLKTIRQEAERLTELTGELLSYTKGFSINPEPTSIPELLEELKLKLLPRAKSQNINFKVSHAQEVTVSLDRRWVLRAIENVVRNAFEALGQGGEVEVWVEERPQEIIFWIKDSGPGIPLENQKQLFEPFFTTKESGFGLGLYLVRKVVEAHGGHIEFESRPGTTLFGLHFPKG